MNTTDKTQVAPKAVNSKQMEPQNKKGTKRMTIQLPEELAEHLEWLAQIQNISQVEAIRRAIATDSYLKQEICKGAKVLVENDQKLKEIILLWTIGPAPTAHSQSAQVEPTTSKQRKNKKMK